jgi:hypothetical protein
VPRYLPNAVTVLLAAPFLHALRSLQSKPQVGWTRGSTPSARGTTDAASAKQRQRQRRPEMKDAFPR